MKRFKLKMYKNKFIQSSIVFPEFSLKTFNINFNNFNSFKSNIKKMDSGTISFLKKFKSDEKTLKLQQIKAKIIKLRKKFNLITLKYKDITTKHSKKGTFKIYLNSPIIYNTN